MVRKAAAVAFIERHGVVLASAKGPVPRLSEFVAGRPVKGSWWGDAAGQRIFQAIQEATGSPDVLTCRLVAGKVTFVHRRLWPALVKVARNFNAGRIAKIIEEHTASGRHIVREVAFPEWVPVDVLDQAERLTEEEALGALGPWTARTRQAAPANATKLAG